MDSSPRQTAHSSPRSKCSDEDVELDVLGHGGELEDSESETNSISIKPSKCSNDIETEREVDIALNNENSNLVDTSNVPDSKLDADSKRYSLDSENTEEDSQVLATDNMDSSNDSDTSEDDNIDEWIVRTFANSIHEAHI